MIVDVSRGTEDERASSPLEIAVGDRLRIGATHWEKQLFNGTVVTVEDIKVRRGGVANNPAKGLLFDGREAGGPGPEGPPVEITARTDDGRKVKFRHDEIRDWYGNIRLDHGYALTIASAQGLTVDRAFLLADARPARETIYPAAHPAPGQARHLRQPGAARPRHRRRAGRQRPGSSGHRFRDTGLFWPNAGRAPCPRRQRSITSPTARGGIRATRPRNGSAMPGLETIRNQRRTATHWRVSRGISGAPPVAGAMARRWRPSPTDGARSWRPTASCVSGPAPRATPRL